MPCWPCQKEIMTGGLCKSCSMDPEESDEEKTKKVKRKRKKK